MSIDQPQSSSDNAEAQIASQLTSAKPIVDMSDPNQVRGTFKSSEGQGQSAVSAAGHMVFSNIYSGNEGHGRHDLGQEKSDGGGGGGGDAGRGGDGGGQWPGRNGGSNDNGGQPGGAGAEQLAGHGSANNNAVEAEVLLNETNILAAEINMFGQPGQGGATAQPTDGVTGTSTATNPTDGGAIAAPSGTATENPPATTTPGGDTTVSTGQTGPVTVQQLESQVQQIEQQVAQVISEVNQLLPANTTAGTGTETQPTSTSIDNPTTTTSGGNGTSAATNPTEAPGSETVSGPSTASGGSGSTGNGAGGGSSSTYNPANDAALQNLSNTGDAQLQQLLLTLWSDVQSGQLSASAYSQFEAAAIPLTDPANDPGGIPFTGDTPLEQAALSSIQSNLSAGDVAALQSLINGGQAVDTGTTDNTGGNGTADNTGGTGTTPPTGADSNSSVPTTAIPTVPAGTIPGVTSANNAKLAADNAALVDGQGTGPDALYMASVNAGLASVDPEGNGFSQRYGYFEATAKIESGGSGWPGFWLESVDHAVNPTGSPSVEMDIMEAQTGNPNGQGDTTYNVTLHSNSGVDGTMPNDPDQSNAQALPGLNNLSSSYNTYGINWQPNDPDVEFYFNGKEIASAPKYDDTDTSPMLVMLDNGTGGWANAPSNTPTGDMYVKSVDVFQNASLINSSNDPGGTLGTDLTITNPAQAPPEIAGVNWVNTFNSDFTTGSESLSGDGAQDDTVWSNSTPAYPAAPWSQKGVSSGPA